MKIEKLILLLGATENDEILAKMVYDLIDAHNREEKPTEKCCGGCLSLDDKFCMNPGCPCHQTASKDDCDCGEGNPAIFHVYGCHNYKQPDFNHQGTEEESQAPHETATKTCTCPHCDYARCDRWDHV